MTNTIQMEGGKIGRWTILTRDIESKYSSWVCKCECGKVKSVLQGNLRRGKSISCGCHRKEYLSDLKTTGGRDNPRLYAIWCKMKDRCYNKNVKDYVNYGARGISVCDEWKHDFPIFMKWSFENGYNDELTIDRINNNEGYSPENCRWATRKEQNKNKRNNHLIEINGVSKTIAEWSEFSGIKQKTIQSRLNYGWENEDLLMNPSWKRRENR